MNFEAWRHYLRGAMFQRRKHPLQAIDEYRAALACDPVFLRATHRLAYLLAAISRDDEAEYWFRETLRIDPGNADAWFNLGYFCDQRQRLDEAVAAFREAARLRPRFDRAWYGLGAVRALLRRRQVVVVDGDHRHADHPVGDGGDREDPDGHHEPPRPAIHARHHGRQHHSRHDHEERDGQRPQELLAERVVVVGPGQPDAVAPDEQGEAAEHGNRDQRADGRLPRIPGSVWAAT